MTECLACSQAAIDGARHCSLRCLVADVRKRSASKPVKAARSTERQVRRGWIYETLIDVGIMESLARGDLPRKTGLEVMRARYPRKKSITQAGINRAVNAFIEDRQLRVEAEGWQMEDRHRAMLGPSDPAMLSLLATDETAFAAALDDMVEAFCQFRDEFITNSDGSPRYANTPQHREWIRETLRTIYTGGRLQLLVSPRMGKSYLMCDFSLWSICRNPEVAILWIGGSADMAELMVSTVRDHLENNETLRQAFLPPGVVWRPEGRGAGSSWTSSEFTVANRQTIGLRSKTMTGIGKQSKVLSRDVDILILDDIEDHESSYTEGARDKMRQWFSTQVESRKEGHTAMIMIGSRQHPLDIYSDHLESSLWKCLTYPAHDPACTKDPNDPAQHTTCMMLYPIRDYEWFLEQKKSMESRRHSHLFLMVYQNDPLPPGATLFPPELVDSCLDRERGFGIGWLPQHPDGRFPYQLVGGLDPAVNGTQAAAVWAWKPPGSMARYGDPGFDPDRIDKGQLYLVDLDLRQGNAIRSALDVVKEMHHRYELEHWVIESNAFQQAILDDKEVKWWTRMNNVVLEPHKTTGQTKHHEQFGVGGIRSWMEEGRIHLPYKPGPAQGAVSQLRRQFIMYEGEAGASRRHRHREDALMAAWFPFKVFRRLQGRQRTTTKRYTYKRSYPGITEFTRMSIPAWGRTKYPGRTGR